jgi:hypothetical protein
VQAGPLDIYTVNEQGGGSIKDALPVCRFSFQARGPGNFGVVHGHTGHAGQNRVRTDFKEYGLARLMQSADRVGTAQTPKAEIEVLPGARVFRPPAVRLGLPATTWAV